VIAVTVTCRPASFPPKPRYQALAATSVVQMLHEVEGSEESRIATEIGELDRVLGGGLVPGGVTLIGGDPGIGKSTLLLQAMAHLSGRMKTLYVSGEESARQVALRARSASLPETNLPVLPEIRLEAHPRTAHRAEARRRRDRFDPDCVFGGS
jgi:DNA repair protein RadA/Sms